MALLKIAFSVPYMALQVKGAGIILNIVSDNSISVWVGSLLTYSIVVVYRLCNCEWSGGIAEMFTNIAGGNCRILLPASHSTGCHGLLGDVIVNVVYLRLPQLKPFLIHRRYLRLIG